MSNLNFDEERKLITPVILYADYINLQFNRYLKKNYKEITPRDFTYLVNILYHDNISQRELSKLLFVSEPNVTQIINRLEKKGFVCRNPSEENRSKKILKLTQKGKLSVITILSDVLSWEKDFSKNYVDDDFEIFKKILYDFADESVFED